MTVPTPSSPDNDGPPRPDQPAGAPGYPAHPAPAPAPAVAEPPSGFGLPLDRELRDGLFAALALTALGVVLGLLWLWLAPRVPMFSDGRAVYLRNPEGEEAIGAEGTFVLLSLGLGALAGAGAFLLRRGGGVGLVVGIAAGAALGAWLAWRLGVWLGPTSDLVAHAREAGKGKVFDGPLELDAKGALCAFPFAALAVHLLITAIFGERDPEPPSVQLLPADGDAFRK